MRQTRASTHERDSGKYGEKMNSEGDPEVWCPEDVKTP
jgi:hypothetical protein